MDGRTSQPRIFSVQFYDPDGKRQPINADGRMPTSDLPPQDGRWPRREDGAYPFDFALEQDDGTWIGANHLQYDDPEKAKQDPMIIKHFEKEGANSWDQWNPSDFNNKVFCVDCDNREI